MRDLLVAGVLVLVLGSAAAAQDRPQADVFGGYSLVRQNGASLHGGELSLAYYLSRRLGIVIDVDAHGHTIAGVDHTTSAALIGPRLSFAAGALTPFVHALIGAVRDEDAVKVFSQTISERHTSAGGAVGGGIDFGRSHFGARVQGDYRLARRADDSGARKLRGDPRVSAGVVFRIGTR